MPLVLILEDNEETAQRERNEMVSATGLPSSQVRIITYIDQDSGRIKPPKAVAAEVAAAVINGSAPFVFLVDLIADIDRRDRAYGLKVMREIAEQLMPRQPMQEFLKSCHYLTVVPSVDPFMSARGVCDAWACPQGAVQIKTLRTQEQVRHILETRTSNALLAQVDKNQGGMRWVSQLVADWLPQAV